MRVSTVFAHCDKHSIRSRVDVTDTSLPYLEIGGVFGIWMSPAQLRELRNTIDAGLLLLPMVEETVASVQSAPATEARVEEPNADYIGEEFF